MRILVGLMIIAIALSGCMDADGAADPAVDSADEVAKQANCDGPRYELSEEVGYARYGYDGEGMGVLESELEVKCPIELTITLTSNNAALGVFGMEIRSAETGEVLASEVGSSDETTATPRQAELQLEMGKYDIEIIPHRAVEATWRLTVEDVTLLA